MMGYGLENIALGHRLPGDPPAARRLRRDRALQLPGDGAALVPAVRRRHRQHLHRQAVRAGPPDAAPDRHAARASATCRRASSISSTAAARSSRRSATTRASARSPSSGRPRWRRRSTAAGTHAGKRVQALGGAKNFVVVMPDADLDRAIDVITESFYGCAGERCLAGSVLLPVGAVHAEARERLAAAAKALKVGDGADDGRRHGAGHQRGSPQARARATSSRASPRARASSSTAGRTPWPIGRRGSSSARRSSTAFRRR